MLDHLSLNLVCIHTLYNRHALISTSFEWDFWVSQFFFSSLFAPSFIFDMYDVSDHIFDGFLHCIDIRFRGWDVGLYALGGCQNFRHSGRRPFLFPENDWLLVVMVAIPSPPYMHELEREPELDFDGAPQDRTQEQQTQEFEEIDLKVGVYGDFSGTLNPHAYLWAIFKTAGRGAYYELFFMIAVRLEQILRR